LPSGRRRKKGRILLFLKKKKQKDFFRRCAAGANIPAGRLRPIDKSLFCFFFLQKKEDSSLGPRN
jgi:hypothetical protein